MKGSFFSLHDLILTLTIVECLCMAVLVRVLPDKHGQSRTIIGCFFLAVALVLASTMIVWNNAFADLAVNKTPVMIVIYVACLLLQGPLLYFYIKSLRSKGHHWSRPDFLHLLPVIGGSIIAIFYGIDTADWRGLTTPDEGKQYAVSFLWALVKFSPFVYVIASARLRYRIHQHLRRGFSSVSEVELRLGDIILLGFLVHWVWTLGTYYVADWVHWSVSNVLGIINNYLVIILINGLFISGLLNAEKLLHPEPIVAEKPSRIKNHEHKIAIIEKAIHVDRIYLESNLNIDRFAARLGLRVRDVSAIIKTHYGTNFFEFINSYRIEEVKRLLLMEEHKTENILDIIHLAGFNSLSTFHRFFKRLVGVTPTEYRRQGGVIHNELEAAPKV